MKILRSILSKTQPAARITRLVREGDAANRSGRWVDAAAAYGAALTLAPGRSAVHVQHGHALKEQGFLAEAEHAYLRAVRLDPLAADTHLQIGHVLKLSGQVERAIAAYETAHHLDPTMPHGHVELAELRARVRTREIEIATNGDLHEQDRSAEAQLKASGLQPDFLRLFDAYFYHQANQHVRDALQNPDRAACLRHFCEVGLEQVWAFAAEHWFDTEFYCETYLGGMAFTPANAYRHWLNVGLANGAAPNRQLWMKDRFGSAGITLDGVELALFAAMDGDDAAGRPWAARAERFLDCAGELARPCAPDAHTAEVYHHLAARLGEGEPDRADRGFLLRQLIADRVPEHRPNLEALARLLQRRGCLGEAARIYRRLEQDGAIAPADHLGLAACEVGLGRRDLALQTLTRACLAVPGDQGLRSQRLDHAESLFGEAWDRGMAHARLGHIADGQAVIARACDEICQALAAGAARGRPAPRAIRRLALVGHASLPQCRFYRIEQTAELLEGLGYAVQTFDLAVDPAPFDAALHGLDAVIFSRVPALPTVIAALVAADTFGLTTFYDMDDLIFDPAYPPPLETYSGLLSRDEYFGLALAVPLFDRAIRMCAYGIASTGSLAEAMRPLVRSGQVLARPNALGRHHEAFARAAGERARSGEGPVTLFYASGGKAHKADVQSLVEPALVELARRHGREIAIVLMGEFPQTAALRSIADQLTVVPAVWDLEAYWTILAEVDINLAALLPDPAADAKSAIKWLEAAMLAIPSVVSDTATYRDIVRPGETALVCRTAMEWTEALDLLVRDAALRRRIGGEARAQALASFSQPVVAAKLDAGLQEISPPADTRRLVVIAHVFYPPQAVGGATRVVADNVRDLRAIAGDRLRIEVFACLDGGTPYDVTSDGVDGVRVTRVGSPEIEALEYRPVDDRMGEIFGAYLDQTRPALVHFHCVQRLTASIVTATLARGIPYLITAHDGWWISEHQFLIDACGQQQTYDMARPITTLQQQGGPAYSRLVALRRPLLEARRVLAVSAPFAALYRACGVPRVETVENGVPPFEAAAARQRRVVGPPGSKVRLGFIGGLARHKGYDLLRIAIAARPWRNLALLLIDHAMPAGSVRHETWGNIAAEFRPKWPQDDIASLYAQIDVLIAPSLWPESYGLVTREAIAAGCFVIASDRGSIGSCVQEGRSGFVVDVGSPEGLIAALERVDADPEQFRQPMPPPPPLRTAMEQAQDIAAIYDSILAEAEP